VAAVLARDGWLWDVATGHERPIRIPDARGFPDTLAFADPTTLRIVFERPAASFVAKEPYADWQPELAAGELDGFYGTAVSVFGDVVTDDSHVVTLANRNKRLRDKTGGFAFSGDGKRLFLGAESALVWFDRAGNQLGEQALACTPDELGVDRTGALVAMECGHGTLMTFEPPSTVRTFQPPHGELSSIESVHVSPSGQLIAVRGRSQLRLLRSADLSDAATLELRQGEPLVEAADGRIMFWGADTISRETTSCVVGHRAYPADGCLDGLLDDALLDALLGS
jgi:hypothetical protein